MIYRPATLEDVPEIVRVVTLMLVGTMFKPPTPGKVGRFIANSSTLQEGVWLGGEMVAFMVGTVCETFLNDEVNAYEKGLFVMPAHRGGRIAARLVRNFEERARAAGASNVWLSQSVGQNQESTATFFEHLGYVRQGFITCKAL